MTLYVLVMVKEKSSLCMTQSYNQVRWYSSTNP